MKNLIGPEMGYVDLLNEYTRQKLSKEIAEGKNFQKTPIRPSAAGACTRELFYQLQQYHGKAKYDVEPIDPETHRLFSLGHSIESNIIRQFELISELFEIRYKQQVLSFRYLEAKNDPKLSQWLEGSLDLVFWSDKYKCVADIKSKKDKFSSFHKTNWDETSAKLRGMDTVAAISDDAFWVDDLEAFLEELNEPFFAANFLQLNLYANSQFLRERGVNHGAIIQYSKNDSRLREIRFRPSEALYEKTVGKFQTVIDAVDAGDEKLAPQDHVLGSIKCAFCPYAKQCWGNQDARKAFFATFPKKQWPTDTGRMGKVGDALEKLFVRYEEQSKQESAKKVTEQAILKLLLDEEIGKVRLPSGDIYEVKHLKDSIVLRRGKL